MVLPQYDSLIKNKRIFIDTCSLLHPKIDFFWQKIVPLLLQYETTIVVPYSVAQELVKIAKFNADDSTKKLAIASYSKLCQLQKENLIEVRGETSETFADNVFLSVFTKFRLDYELVLITQDVGLAKDIIQLNKNQSVISKKIMVMKINHNGDLVNFFNASNKSEPSNKKTHSQVNINAFALSSKVTDVADDVLEVKHYPSENQSVITHDAKKIKLLSKVAEGGEGIIYETDCNKFVAKIYKASNNTRRKRDKINLMLSRPIYKDGVCYPIATLYNEYKEFIGYLMPKASGVELQKIFIKKNLYKRFPNWNKKNTVELCLTILEKIKFLHEHNIILGDINPNNILIVDSKTVFFVDVDSYQVEDFPCPVGTINFTAPEIQRKNFSTFLRTKGNENFAIATLLFMIMLPGKPPYAQQGGEDQVTNIINMNFSYPCGEKSNNKTPDGPWKYIWSHLLFNLKEEFYLNFRVNERKSKEQTRTSINQWIKIFQKYLKLLEDGTLQERDPMALDLFPTRHKMHSKITYIKCHSCNEETPKERTRYGLCYTCQNKEYKNTHCVECNSNFSISYQEYKYLKSKNLELFKRCKNCRSKKKNTAQNHKSSSYSTKTNTAHSAVTSNLLSMLRSMFK